MSQSKEPEHDKNNELLSKLNGIFGGNDEKNDNNKPNELTNYIDGKEGEEIIPSNRRSNNDEKEMKSSECDNTSNKTTICRIIGGVSIVIGIVSFALGFVISPYFFMAVAVATISVLVNIGIVNSENRKKYLQEYIANNEPPKCKENECSTIKYKNCEKQKDNIKTEQTGIENHKSADNDITNTNGAAKSLNEKTEYKDTDDKKS